MKITMQLNIKYIIILVTASCWLNLSFSNHAHAGAGAAGLFLINSAMKIGHRIPVEKDIAYGEQKWQELNLYPQPEQSAAPVVIFVYGGGWYKGKKEQYHFVADALVRRGYLVVIPDYIKYPKGRFPTFIEDVALATAWVKNNISQYGGDPNQILMAGHSAGAHTGALLAADENYLNAVGLSPTDITAFVGLAGPYNFTPKAKKYVKTFGQENFEIMKANHHVNGNEPPILLLHSRGDKTVGVFNLETFRNKLVAEGSAVDTKLFDDIGHAAMVLKIHPWFADEVDLGQEMDTFFRAALADQRTVATEAP